MPQFPVGTANIIRGICTAVMIITLTFYCCSGLIANTLRATHYVLAGVIDRISLASLAVFALSGATLWASGSVVKGILFRIICAMLNLLLAFAIWVLPYELTYTESRFYSPFFYQFQFIIGIVILVCGIVLYKKFCNHSGAKISMWDSFNK